MTSFQLMHCLIQIAIIHIAPINCFPDQELAESQLNYLINFKLKLKIHIQSKAVEGLGALRPFSVQVIDSASLSLTEEDKLLCPVLTLSFYLDRVKEFRSPAQKRLIISYQRGLEKDLSSQTISRYIKEAIILAHKESDPSSLNDMTVRPRSVRHATSLSALRGCSLDELLRAGAWASPNVFLSHYVQSFSVNSL